MKLFSLKTGLLLLLAVGVALSSCKKKDKEVISGFTYKVDATDFLKVTFTNASQNATTYSWDFGDGSPASTEENPTHSYTALGSFTVKLTAKGDGGTEISQQTLTLTDPDAELGKLAGAVSKTWHLLRVPGTNKWPLEVGPIAKDQVWWAQGRDNDEIALRPCIMNDEWIFGRDGSMQYKTNGDYWAEGGVFEPANECRSSAAGNMTGPGGSDLSAFGDGTHTYVLTTGTKPTLEVKGLGAFIGLPKIGTETEVKVPQNSVKFDIISLTEGTVYDELVIESDYKFDAANAADDAYWKVTLVSYHNPADEPAIPDPSAQASFAVAQDKLTVTLTNNSKYASSYLWDFGDGSTSTETSPTHTYAADGEYTIKLTATSSGAHPTNATNVATQTITASSGVVTEANIIGAAWKVRKAETSVFVGPGLGSSAWWSCPLVNLDGTKAGTPDDWSCMPDDEFIFTAGGKYEYKTNGSARNDGYMGKPAGTPNGCMSDAEIAASGLGAAFGSGVHSWAFTPAAGTNRARITLTNGASGAAFLGFYKGYYGGENDYNPANTPQPQPNGGNTTNQYEIISYIKAGGVETLTVSVDISAAHDGTAAWTMVLVR